MKTTTLVFVAQITDDKTIGHRAKLVDLPTLHVSAFDNAALLRDARACIPQGLKKFDSVSADWPSPRPMSQVRSKVMAAGETLMLIDVQVDDAPMRVSISIGEHLLKRLNRAATAQDMTRSGCIAAAVRHRFGVTSGSKASSFKASSQRL